ncbi:MAG: PTS sugar transporter subunit IIA [Candidatus Krumholzibacteriota bacterium]|nr:PTS sugar transporter subunit IIA [Candidatus Krumholzibacteriota bacterium]
MRLSSKLKKNAVRLDMKASTKKEALGELVGLLCDAHRLSDRDTILEAILRREKKQSTGVGMGLALPHAKTPVVKELHVAFGRSARGVDFDAIDGELAKIFFILVSPKDVSGPHIVALAGISRLVKHEAFREKLLSCPDEKTLLDIVRRAEDEYL